MKIQKHIAKAISFVNAPVPDYISKELRSHIEFNAMNEHILIPIKDDINLCVEKTWHYDRDLDDIYFIYFSLSYGTGDDMDYEPTDEVSFEGVDIHRVNIADEITYLLGCAFPNCKIER